MDGLSLGTNGEPTLSEDPVDGDWSRRGEWWIPARVDLKVPGTLTARRGESPVLEVLGEFPDISQAFETPRDSVVLGLDEDGNEITLVACYPAGSKRGGGAVKLPSHYRFRALGVLVGAHFTSEREIKFESLAGDFTHLAEWIGEHPFQSTGVPGVQGQSDPRAVYQAPALLEVDLPSERARLTIESGFEQRSIYARSLTWLHRVSATITPSEPQHWGWFRERLYHFQHLVSLATDELSHPVSLRVRVGVRETGSGQTVPAYATWHFAAGTPSERPKPPLWNSFLILFDDSRVAELIQTWFEMRHGLQAPLGAYFGERYADRLYIELQMMSLMRAFEGLFRDREEKFYLPPGQFKKVAKAVRKGIPEGLDEELVDALRGAISGANRWALVKRLRTEIGRWTGTAIERLFPASEDFAASVKPIRDHLAHGLPLGDTDASYDVMVDGVQRLRALLTAMLLHRVGLSREEIGERFAVHPRMHFLMNHL